MPGKSDSGEYAELSRKGQDTLPVLTNERFVVRPAKMRLDAQEDVKLPLNIDFPIVGSSCRDDCRVDREE